MNLRLALATALMITVWAVMSSRFQPSPTPTAEQLLPPHTLAKSKQIRGSLSSATQFALLNLPASLQHEPRKRFLTQLRESISGLQILCISSQPASEPSDAARLTLTDCSNGERNHSDPILFWRSIPNNQAEIHPSIYHELETKLVENLTPVAVKQSQLFAPELVRRASWQAASNDLVRIAPLLGIIIFVVPLLAFRSFAAPAFIFLTASMTTTTTLLLFNLSLHGGFNALLLAVIPLVWAVSSMDAAHLVERIETYQRRGSSRAFQHAVRELAPPCAITTATTFVGFGALALQGDSPLLRSFGLTAAVGTLLAMGFTFLLGWLLLNHRHAQESRPYVTNPFAVMSHTLVRASLRHPLATLVLWVTVAVSLVPFATRVTTQTPFPNIFSHDHPLSQQTERLQQLLTSDLRPLSIYLTAEKPSGENRKRLLHALIVTTDYVSKLPESRIVLPAAIVQAVCDEACIDGDKISDQWSRLVDSSGVARIDVFFSSLNQERQREIIDWLEHFDRTMLGHHRLVFDGPGYLYPAVESLAVSGAVSGILLSLSGILLLLWLAFRQISLVVPALVVTLLPLWFVVGSMGAADIDWSLALLGVPAMLFGLSVDDTVHLLWHRKSWVSLNRILRHNALRSGTALTTTTLMLCLCVSTLALSSLQANLEIALLLTVGMALALLMDLTLLPALINLMRRKSPQSLQ
ncbi:MAG: MMPL family transporter [Candidatus Thiodiazotropha sp.]